MKCRQCGTGFRLDSDTAPGNFFWIGVICCAIGVAAGLAAWRWPGATVAYVVTAITLAAAAACGAGVWTGATDNVSMTADGRAASGKRCPACGEVNPIRPWSR